MWVTSTRNNADNGYAKRPSLRLAKNRERRTGGGCTVENAGFFPKNRSGSSPLSQFFLCFWIKPKAPKDQALRKVAEAVRSGGPRACHVRTQPNNHRCAKRTTSSALHRRREQIERRFERPERVCANGVDLACPLRENRRPIPAEVSCGHFWRRLLVTKGGKDFLAGNSRREGRDISDAFTARFC